MPGSGGGTGNHGLERDPFLLCWAAIRLRRSFWAAL